MTNDARLMSEYLRRHAANGTIDNLPEGSINAVFNLGDPQTRAFLKEQQKTVENFRESGGRSMPFEPKRDLGDLGIDADIRKVIDRADTESAISSLHERLGTADQQSRINEQPASRREMIEAAFNIQGNEEN